MNNRSERQKKKKREKDQDVSEHSVCHIYNVKEPVL